MAIGGEGGPKSIEELRAAQEAHLAQIQAEREQAEREAEEEKRLRVQAREDYVEGGRQETLDQIKQTRAEADQMEAENIRERQAQAEKLRGDAAEKREALDNLTAQFAAARERVKEVGDIIKGVPEDEVLPEVRESFDTAQREHLTLIVQAQHLEGEISKLEDQIPSVEQVQKYEGLLTKLAELDDRMAQIESNPALVELIMREAKSEDEQRDKVVHAALAEASRQSYGSRREDRRARDLGEVVAQTFISEVLASSGLDEIKDPAERQRRVYVILSEMFAGVATANKSFGFESIARERDFDKQHNMYNGLVLLNLLGGHGTLGGTLGFMRFAEKGVRLGQVEDHTQDHIYNARAVSKHINSLNLLRAYSQGLKGHRHLDEFIPGFAGWQNDFDRQVGGGGEQGIDAWSDKPIVPRSAPEAEKTRIRERFEAEKKKAEELEVTLKQEEEKAKEAAIQNLETQIAKIDEGVRLYEEAVRINQGKPLEYQNLVDREGGIPGLREEQERLEREIANLEEDLSHLGLFARGEKRDLREKIDHKRTRYNYLRTNIPQFEEQAATIREALTFLNKQGAKGIEDLRRKRQDLASQLERVKRGY